MNRKHTHPKGPRHPAHIGLLLALALWAILIAAGSAAALAAGAADSTTEPEMSPGALSAAPSDSGPQATTPAQPDLSAQPGTAAQPGSAMQPGAEEEPQGLDSLLGPEPPTRVRVAILNATGKPGGANKVAVLLGEYKRQALEDQIGLQIEVVNLSTAEGVRPGQSILFYRPEFLRAALAMAKAIPGEQFVEPMRPAGLKRAGVDVEILVGKELP